MAGFVFGVDETPLWVEGMVAGKGWIALALTTFATRRPARVLLGACLFDGVTMLQFHLQGRGVDVPSQFLVMLPYLAMILVLVLVLISRNAAWIKANMPASLGKPFSPGGSEARGPGTQVSLRLMRFQWLHCLQYIAHTAWPSKTTVRLNMSSRRMPSGALSRWPYDSFTSTSG